MRSPFHGRVFRPGLLPTLVTLPLLALLLWLGHWQWTRAGEKQALLDRWTVQSQAAPVSLPVPTPLPGSKATDARYLRVVATGAFLPTRQVLLDNQTHAGRAGYRVLTPLVLADGSALMVDRGWVPLPGNARDRLPDISVSAAGRQVRGRLDHFRQAALRGAAPPPVTVPDNQPRVLNYPDAAGVTAAVGRPVYPFVLLLDANEPDGFVRDDAPAMEFGPERHLGYAIQWWGLALTLVLLWGWTAMKPAGDAVKPRV